MRKMTEKERVQVLLELERLRIDLRRARLEERQYQDKRRRRQALGENIELLTLGIVNADDF